MIVTGDAVDAALKRAMTSVKNLSIFSEATGGFSAPICIICNCLCDSHTLCWINKRAIFEKREFLQGPISIPTQVRDFYMYRGEGRQMFMNSLLLSPHATMKKSVSSIPERPPIISFSCCKLCHEHVSAPRYVIALQHYNLRASNDATRFTFRSNTNDYVRNNSIVSYCTTYSSKNT